MEKILINKLGYKNNLNIKKIFQVIKFITF